MRVHRRLAALTVFALALVASIPAVSAAATKKKQQVITISGATGSAPLVTLLAKTYHKTHPNVTIKVAQGGGEVGVSDAEAGKVSIGDAARDPRASDPKDLVWYPIAKDSLCFAVNPANGVTNLSPKQAQDIWTGAVRDWSAIPGSNLSGTIDLISRTGASSQPPLVRSLLLGNKAISSLASLKTSDGQVRQAIINDKNAIGHLSGVYTLDGKVKPLGWGGVACNVANAKSGQYPGVRTYYEVTKGKAKGAAWSFINWMQNGKKAKEIISKVAVPVR